MTLEDVFQSEVTHYADQLSPTSNTLLGRHGEGLVIAMTGEVRIVNCRDDIQWIVQRWTGTRWKSLSFCRTREALIRDTRRRLNADIPAKALAILQALPERHP